MGDQPKLTPAGAYAQGQANQSTPVSGVQNIDTANTSYAPQGKGSTGTQPVQTAFGFPLKYMGQLSQDSVNNPATPIAKAFSRGLTGRVIF